MRTLSMDVDTWAKLWAAVILASILTFAGISLVVAVGGLSDLRQMLRSISHQHERQSNRQEETR